MQPTRCFSAAPAAAGPWIPCHYPATLSSENSSIRENFLGVGNALVQGSPCHGPAGVPRLATRCLCLLSTWLVVCLVPCAPMSIVCPLPSCYLIIVSVAPAVSPSLPSFVSLYSSPCVCSPVLIRCLSCVECHVSSCLTVLQSSACLLVFPLRGGFCCSLFCFIIKNNNNLCI